LRVWRSLQEYPAGLPYPVFTIGNFDGVHVGHQRIFEEVRRRAEAAGGTPLALTFEPHPARVLAPEAALKLLSLLPVKLELLEQAGMAGAVVLPFTMGFSRLSPHDFARDVLAAPLGAREVIVGDNFRFGYRHTGDVHALEQFGRELGFQVDDVPPVRVRGRLASSSRIRQLLAQGRLAAANRLLGRCFSVRGRVVRGRGIGRTQTVPTLNLEEYTEVLPAVGVYVTETACDGVRANSVTNVGYSPTFDHRGLGVESFLLDATPPPVAEHMEIIFRHRLREEVKFPSAETLKAQIMRDIERARAYFRRIAKLTGLQSHQ
jgi:riboflavin kinase/FMN adenylyltransferase